MEKASTVLRRSGVRLRTSLGGSGGHADLQMVVAQLKDVKACQKALSQSEAAAWQDITKWSLREDNRAIQDALCQIGELVSLWTDIQKEFVNNLRDFRHHFEMIMEGEKGLDTSKATLETAEGKELKLRKEIKKAAKKATRAELGELHDRLTAAEREKDVAQAEVCDRSREQEVVKMIRVKDGLLKLTQAYVDMAQKCEIIFSANKSIAQRIPDVEGSDVQDVKYTGSGSNMRTVLTTKDRIKNFRRFNRSFIDSASHQQPSSQPVYNQHYMHSQSLGDLPPPYSENPPENPYYSEHRSTPSPAAAAGASASNIPAPPAVYLPSTNSTDPSSMLLYPRLNQSLPHEEDVCMNVNESELVSSTVSFPRQMSDSTIEQMRFQRTSMHERRNSSHSRVIGAQHGEGGAQLNIDTGMRNLNLN